MPRSKNSKVEWKDIANVCAFALHATWTVVFLSLWAFNKKNDGSRRDLVYPLYASYGAWRTNETALEKISEDGCAAPKSVRFGEDMRVSPAWKDSGARLSLHWMVTSFFALSALFQLLAYLAPRKYIPNPVLRFVEYSITASLMIVIIGLQLGIFSAQVLILLACLTAVTMVCGIVAELLCEAIRLKETKKKTNESILIDDDNALKQRNEKLKQACARGAYVSHGLGWGAQVAVWGFILIPHFLGSQRTCGSPERAPDFVHAIVYGEAFLFTFFGVAQFLYLARLIDASQAEIFYTSLSFISKTFLGWLVYSGNFAD